MVKAGKVSRMARDCRAVAAIEFAFLAPVFLAITFALIELICFIAVKTSLENATVRIAQEMRVKREAGSTVTLEDMRASACQGAVRLVVKQCDSETVKIAVYYAGRLPYSSLDYMSEPSLPVKNFLDTQVPLTWGDIWIIMVQVNWPFILPTAKLLGGSVVEGEDGKPVLVAIRTATVARKLTPTGK